MKQLPKCIFGAPSHRAAPRDATRDTSLSTRATSLAVVAFLLFCLTMITLFPTVGVSQTLFTWPDSRIDVGTYESIESCLAAADRVGDSLRARSDTMFDTLPPRAAAGLRPVRPEVQTTVQRCLHRFPIASIPLSKWRLAQQLYLLAGNDAGASAIVSRRLDTVPPANSGQRADVLRVAISVYLATTPTRLDSAQRLVEALTQLTHAGAWKAKLLAYRGMMLASMQCDRPELGKRYAQTIVSLSEVLADSVHEKADVGFIAHEVARANVVLYHDMLMDSLRKSDEAYANVLRKKFHGTGATNSRFPELRGDFIFPASAKNERFPRPGKLTLVIRFAGDQRDRNEWETNGFARRVRIRRIKQQFPELDIVLVATTGGAIVPLAPPSPAEEAALFEKMVLGFGKLPATLIVYTRSFFSLPDPDRRKLGLPTALDEVWPKSYVGSAVLIDGTGATVGGLRVVTLSDEKRLFEFIQIVYNRELKHSQANAR